jgi:hypothetical protein
MTLPEFTLCFAGVAKRYRFEVRTNDEIRGWYAGAPFCPITAVAHALTRKFKATNRAFDALPMIGVADKDAAMIIEASDGRARNKKQQKIRRAFIAAIKRAA